jgi:aerobic carbon-monoxide dehydrogenase large subunit
MGFNSNAQPTTTSFADYCCLPPPKSHRLAFTSPRIRAPKNPLGTKGIGECGAVPAAAAIISGIEDALRDYDMRIDETPISPARLFQRIQASIAVCPDGRTFDGGYSAGCP